MISFFSDEVATSSSNSSVIIATVVLVAVVLLSATITTAVIIERSTYVHRCKTYDAASSIVQMGGNIMSKGLTFILDKKQSRSDMAKHGYSVLICSIIIYIIMYGNFKLKRFI